MPGPPRTVTGLRELPRGRVAVELDDAPWRILPAGAVARTGLATGRPVDRETARTLARELRNDRALERAARALRTRDRSRGALDRRLALAGVPAAARDAALATLERAGLVDDARVARTRAETLAGRGYGDAAIRAALVREGVAADLAAAAVAELEPEPERARSLVAERGRADARTLRRLTARGFAPETVADVAGFAEDP